MESRPHNSPVCRSRAVAALCSLMLLVGCASRTVDEVASHDWIELRSNNFVMMTDIGESRAAGFFHDLESFREYLVEEHPRSFPSNASPVRVVALGNGNAFQLIVNEPHVGGGFQQTYRGDYAIADLSLRIPDGRLTIDSARAGGRRFGSGSIVPIYVFVARHLLHHEFVEYVLSGDETLRYPLWFREGYAEYLSTFRVIGDSADPTRERRAIVGELPHYRLSLVRNEQWMPWEALLAARSYDTGHSVDLFYAQSWLLVHYLMNRPGGKERLAQYFALVNEGEPVAGALTLAFEMTAAELHRALKAYSRKEKFRVGRITLKASSERAFQIRPMSIADVRFELGYVRLHFGGDQAAALRLFEQSLADDPANSQTRAELAKLYLARERLVDAAKTIDEGLVLGTPDANLLTAQGHLSIHDALEAFREGEPDWYGGLEKARVAFREAVDVDPLYAEAYLAFGQSFMVNKVVPNAAFSAVERARDLLPSNMDVLYILARLHLNNENFDEAAGLFQEVVNWSRQPDLISRSRMFLEKIAIAVDL